MLAEQAEEYLRAEQRARAERGQRDPHRRGPNRNHDTRAAEREWAAQFQ